MEADMDTLNYLSNMTTDARMMVFIHSSTGAFRLGMKDLHKHQHGKSGK